MLKQAIDFICPRGDHEQPAWFYRVSRFIMFFSLLLIPTLYDASVAEVAGDIRWTFMHSLTLLIGGLFFVARLSHPQAISLKQPAAVWVMVVLALAAILSTIDTYSTLRSWWFLKHMLAYCGMFGILYILRHPNWYQALAWAFVLPITLNGLLTICQFQGIYDSNVAAIIPFWEHIGFLDYFKQSAPPGASFANKNLNASWHVMVLPLTVYLVLTSRHVAAKTFAAILFTLGSISLLYTRSRASWVSAAAAVVFFGLWLLLNGRVRREIWSHISLTVLILFAISGGTIYYTSQGISAVAKQLGSHSIDKTVAEQASSIVKMDKQDIGPRLAYNLNGLEILKDHWINGVGIGAFHTVYPNYHDAAIETPRHGYSIKARPQRLHNDVMQAFVEMGPVGGLSFIALFFLNIYMGWKLSRNEKLREFRLLPVFLATGMTGLCINAVGDFPLQMPTAPGILWSMIGVMTGLYMLYQIQPSGSAKSVPLPRILSTVLAALFGVALVYVTQDNLARREGAHHLKYAMSFTNAGMFNDQTLLRLKRSHQAYPWNSRLMEFRGVIYTNYKGSRPMSLDKVVAILNETLEHDPFAANTLINLAGTYHRQAIRARNLGDKEVAQEKAHEMLDIFIKLQHIAPFSPHTWTLGGLAYLVLEEPNKALALFNKGIEADPNYKSASNGRKIAINMLKAEGKTQAEIDILDGKKMKINLGGMFKEAMNKAMDEATKK